MSASPSEDYIKATKLIETFSSFFDKVNTVSNNQDLNSKKLSQLKKALYQNMHSSDKILAASEDLCTKIPEPSKQLLRTNSRTSTSSDDFNSQRGELHSSALSQSNAKARSFAPSPTQSGVIKNESKQTASQDGFGDSLFDKPQLSTEYLPSTSFLALIKAASHSDMSKLFSLTSSYSNIRAFSDKHQAIFTALCFSYLEKLVKEKSKDLNVANQNKDMDSLEAKENEFLTACKNFTQGNNETDMLKKFYENFSTNARLYHQAISIFKSHIERILADKNINARTKTESFEWMNDVDSNADSAFFQGLAQELKCGLKFLILTSDKLTEKTFSADKTDASSKKELTIFYDKASRSAFLLYPSRKAIEDEMESSLYHKTKLKMISGHHHKPPLNSDSLKSLKTLGADYGGSLTTLDTVSGSVTSLNDLVENKEREKPVQPRILTLSKPSQLRKANTLNVFTNSLNECSSSFTYPESAVVRPSTEKIVPPSPHSASKDLGYYRSRTYDEEDSLTPKGKEPAPRRPSNFNTLRENSIVDERISDIPAQNLAQKLSKEVLSNRNFFLDRSSTQEYKRPYMSDSKPKGDLLGKTYSMDFSVGEFTLRRGSEKPSVVRPTVVPIAVKSRLDRFNQTINKHDQEVIRLTSKYLKKENNTEKENGLTNIMNSYQAIMNQTKNNNGFRPTIGAALKMDD